MKEFKPRDKLTQRMTRDGAVLDNQTTGAEIHISERDAEKQLSPNGQPIQMGKRDAPMNPTEDAPKHGRQLRPQEQKEPEKEQPKPQQPSAEPFQPQSSSPVPWGPYSPLCPGMAMNSAPNAPKSTGRHPADWAASRIKGTPASRQSWAMVSTGRM